MNELRFTWDSDKAKRNEKRHRVSFEEAQTVFLDEHARFQGDPDHSEEEERFLLLGMSARLRILVVCHCYHSKDQEIRIFSARKATKKEREQYEEFLP
jgi:uncharacterized DUF497 family protein